MKIAIYKFTVHLSVRSVVTGYANAAELYAKKHIFGEESIKVGDIVRVVDVDPAEEAERLSRALPADLFEKTFGTLKEEWADNMQKFKFKETQESKETKVAKPKKSARKSVVEKGIDDGSDDTAENGSEE